VQLIDGDTATPSFTAPAVSASTVLTFQLEVTDTGSLSDTDQVDVTVNNAGNLSVSVDPNPPDQIDLTTEGSSDWTHWGYRDAGPFPNTVFEINQKDLVTDPIGTYTPIGTVTAQANIERPTLFSWSDGDTTAGPADSTSPVSDTDTGVFFADAAVGEGISLTIPAGTVEGTLKVYLGLQTPTAKFTASLSDTSAPDVEVLIDNDIAQERFKVVTVNFGAATDGQDLTIEYTTETDLGNPLATNISLQAVSLGN
jgi:hypothetical protein